MINVSNPRIRDLLLNGEFGLEKEGLRVTADGHFAATPHPFTDAHIVRDFCENQVEINTDVCRSAEEAVSQLNRYLGTVHDVLRKKQPKEFLWPVSNPPYIRDDSDIPVARFFGDMRAKTRYRNYLSQSYGKRKMTFCGIHINYSFSEELLRALFETSGYSDIAALKNDLYLHTAARFMDFGWIINILFSASPLLDGSFFDPDRIGETVVTETASVRCGEYGYWNRFVPVLCYDSLPAYCGSVRRYIDSGMLSAESELYYPARLKPKGKNTLDNLEKNGVNHLEIRNVDLNPFSDGGIDVRDLRFTELLIGFLASLPREVMTEERQFNAVQNFKNAAKLDLDAAKISLPDGAVLSARQAAERLLLRMSDFYADFGGRARDDICFQKTKLTDSYARYACRMVTDCRENFVQGFLRQITT